MNPPLPGSGALPVRRSYRVDTERLTGVVVEIDATLEEHALAVLQAGLHERPPGHRLGFGYDVTAAGLGAWVGDRRVRVRIWPAIADETGAIEADDPDEPGADVLVIDFDPTADADALAGLAQLGRLIVAGPDAGPVPLVVDLDPALVADVTAAAST